MSDDSIGAFLEHMERLRIEGTVRTITEKGGGVQRSNPRFNEGGRLHELFTPRADGAVSNPFRSEAIRTGRLIGGR